MFLTKMSSAATYRIYLRYLSCICVITFCICGITIEGASGNKQDEFLQDLKHYEIITPSRVTSEGNHITFTLHPEHSLRRRSADFNMHFDDDDTLHYKVEIDKKIHILQINPNYKLTSPGFVIERKKNVYKNVTDSTFTRLQDSHRNCHYHGKVVNQSDTKVALGICNGLHGYIQTENGDYFIEPIKSESTSADSEHHHVVYRRSALPAHLDPLSSVHVHKRSATEDASCGVGDYRNAYKKRERWELHHSRKRRSSTKPHRSKRSFSTERYVETLVVVDPSMIKYHKNEHLETYVLTIMNMVAAMFHDASIGNSINIILVRILLMEEEQEELVITHHADNSLNSFCKFQKKINFKDDDHPNHHDVAILLTRHNICSRLNEPCSTLGLAQVSGMCQPHRSCSINEDTGLALAYTVTHELGHNFGMHHDGSTNGCADPPGKQLYIMSPSLVADSLTKSWSNCSKAYITKFIDRDWGYCLNDEPAGHEYKFPVLPPGTMYDADHQCRLQYGNDDATICTNEQDVCSNLWCRSDNKCSTHLEAAAEGTICGTNKWCYQGECVKIGDRQESINGEWGVWTPWTDCTRSCGAGISHSQRHCDNPAPSHGGKYCLGERKRYRICNTEDCPDDGVTFNEKQCQEFNYVPYKKRLYEWEHVQSSESPCQLHCKPKKHFFSVLLKDIVSDGTPCTAGTRNMCISGRCRHVGCDYVIDSKAIEDRCGVCHGDGSTCTTIKSQFNESQGLGYVEAAVIPTGARNIRVEEVAAVNNFLALQNDKGEYHLNGHWFIQWSGDYKVAGTVVQYKREENKESFEAAGPLKEPLHIMLLLQSENPGVIFEYTVPKDNISEPRVPEFHWQYQHWTHCTASCGGGSQRSEVVCKEIEAGIVGDMYCNISNKPDDKQKVCNDHLCPARWWVGPWQHCSVTCGNNGQHQRTVICVRSLGADEQIALDDEACLDTKPAEIEACHKKEPCPSHSAWITGEWSSCNGNPCGLKYRTVTCENPSIGCEGNVIPVSEMQCSNVSCGQWLVETWTECTRSCGEGVQVRKVTCEGESEVCDTKTKPLSQQNCTLGPCPTNGPKTPVATSTERITVHSTKTSTVNSNVTPKPDSLNEQDESVKEVSRTDTSNSNAEVAITTDKSRPVTSTAKPVAGGELEENRDSNTDIINYKQNNDSDKNIGSDNTNKVETKEEYIEIENFDTVHSADGIKENKDEKTLNTNMYDSSLDKEDVEQELEVSTQESVFNSDFTNKEASAVVSDHGIDNSLSSTKTKYSKLTDGDAKVDEKVKDVTETNVEHKEVNNDTNLSDTTTPEKSDAVSETKLDQTENRNGENQVTRHKHRHHHGETLNAIENVDVDERKVMERQENNGNKELDSDSEKDAGKEFDMDITDDKDDEEDYSIEEETFDESKSIVHGDKANENGNDDNHSLDNLDKITEDEKVHSLKPDYPHLTNVNEFPALPDKDKLHPLPDMDNLPLLPSNGEMPNLPKLPDIKDLAPLPKLEDLPPFPKNNDLANNLPLAALPDLNKVPSLSNYKDLPHIPYKKNGLASFPDIGNLPPLPNMKDFPKKDYLPPLHLMQKSPDMKKAVDSKHEAKTEILPLDINVPQEIKLPVKETTDDQVEDNQHLPHTDKNADKIMTSTVPRPVLNVHTKVDSSSNTGAVLDKINKSSTAHPIPAVDKSDSSDDVVVETDKVLKPGLVPEHKKSIEESDERVGVEPVKQVYKWMTLEWTKCSRNCGGGIRTRSVKCVDAESGSKVNQHLCDIDSKPVYNEGCNTQDCLEWTTLDWSPCSTTCGVSIRSRRVFCPQELSCDPAKEPKRKDVCDVPDCVMWVSGQWSRCNKKCGGGEHVRLVQCVNLTSQLPSRGCDYSTKPSERQKCNKDPCKNSNAAALTIKCEHNEMSSIVCRALSKMGQCQRRFVGIKCCKTCRKELRKKLNKDRPRTHALR